MFERERLFLHSIYLYIDFSNDLFARLRSVLLKTDKGNILAEAPSLS